MLPSHTLSQLQELTILGVHCAVHTRNLTEHDPRYFMSPSHFTTRGEFD